MKTYTTKTGLTQFKPSIQQLERATHANCGFCLACGAKASCVEPDAVKYTCQTCKAPKVYGADELILMGLYYDAKKVVKSA